MNDVIVAGIERLACALEALAAAQVDQSRVLESLALAVARQGRQGMLRIKVEAPQSKLRGKRRRLKKAVSNGQEVR